MFSLNCSSKSSRMPCRFSSGLQCRQMYHYLQIEIFLSVLVGEPVVHDDCVQWAPTVRYATHINALGRFYGYFTCVYERYQFADHCLVNLKSQYPHSCSFPSCNLQDQGSRKDCAKKHSKTLKSDPSFRDLYSLLYETHKHFICFWQGALTRNGPLGQVCTLNSISTNYNLVYLISFPKYIGKLVSYAARN